MSAATDAPVHRSVAPDPPESGGLRSLVVGKSDKLWVQLGRYVVVGGLAFVVDMAVLIALTELGVLPYLASAAVAFLFGLTTNYLLSVTWVFDTRKTTSPWIEFAIFALVGVVGLGINEVVMWSLTDGLGVWYVGSKLVATAMVFAWNFGVRKIALF